MYYESERIKKLSEKLMNEPSKMLISDYICLISSLRNASSRLNIKRLILNTYNAIMSAENIDLELKFQLKVAVSSLSNGQPPLIS
ncbi:hypothetical protein [Clostridium thermarum]|uniref:hypothetical protein n=1 Tax=Clostridium thermarum TaxID=1716543 RepID=UPI001123DCBA|nr:hypothetical protein [Clostridium thermarum]